MFDVPPRLRNPGAPSTQYLRILVPFTVPLMVFETGAWTLPRLGCTCSWSTYLLLVHNGYGLKSFQPFTD